MLQRLKALFGHVKSFFGAAEVKVERRMHDSVRRENSTNSTNKASRGRKKSTN